jgi:hypothetical protein
VLYRIASILMLLFAAGHTLGFRKTDPAWGIDGLVSSMHTIHFRAQGFSRTYWDFFAGFGFFVSVFLVLAAILAWQLGGLPAPALAPMRPTAWALALCFGVVTVLSWRFFFAAPVIFSAIITLCLVAAALLSRQSGHPF